MRVVAGEPTGSSELERLSDDVARLREELALTSAALRQRELESSDKERQLERYAADLRETFKEERTRSHELRESYKATVRALSNAVEARDAYTGKHADRVTAYGIAIALALGVSEREAAKLEFGFLLHDIGKIAIADAILYKPGALTANERALMAQHPVIGADMIAGIEFLKDASTVIRSHHERWDGSGYPDGLSGEQIPLPARVFTVADVLDALTSDRPYRPASSLSAAREIISLESGRHFDPQVVAAFNSIPDEIFEEIRREVR